jgi:hypothetical protein
LTKRQAALDVERCLANQCWESQKEDTVNSAFLRMFTMLILALAGLSGPLLASAGAQALEQGTITVTKSWAPGQEPNEVVEVCFVVTGDPDGTDVLGEACTFDDTYTVTFGPSDPPLATGVPYYVWENVGAGWTVTGDNPVEVSIPDTTGQAEVTFENTRAQGIADITIHKAVCPETTDDLFSQCHDNRVPGVHFSIKGARVTTDAEGVANASVASGTVRITEAAADFSETATAGAAWAYCSTQPGGTSVLYDDLVDHRSIAIDVPAGATVVCDWYDLTTAEPQAGTLELHKRVCPTSNPIGDIFEQCHDFPPQQPVGFSVDEGAARFVDELGNVVFTGLSAGEHSVQETEGPPLAYVQLAIWCSVQGSEQAPFQLQPDGPNFTVPVGEGHHVICDVYNIPQDLSGRTPTPVPGLTIAINPNRGENGELVAYNGDGYTPGGAVYILMTGDGLIVAETQADGDGSISGNFTAPARSRLTGESTNDIPVFAIDQETGRESNRVTFTYLAELPTATATSVPPTATPTPMPVIGRPIHIHAGTCANLETSPRYNLTDLTTPDALADGFPDATVAESSFTIVNVSLDELLEGDYALNAHPSHEEMRPFVACGEIGGPQRADGSVVVGIREQNGSGLTGIAFLRPDPSDPDQTQVSVFLAPGLAEEDPTLLPASPDDVVIRSVVTNGPVSPEFQSGYEITIYGDGRVEIVITPEGASPGIPEDERTAEVETISGQLSAEELAELLGRLMQLGVFDLTLASDVDPDNVLVGGETSLLALSLIDGTWEFDANGLPPDQAETLEEAQALIAGSAGLALESF